MHSQTYTAQECTTTLFLPRTIKAVAGAIAPTSAFTTTGTSLITVALQHMHILTVIGRYALISKFKPSRMQYLHYCIRKKICFHLSIIFTPALTALQVLLQLWKFHEKRHYTISSSVFIFGNLSFAKFSNYETSIFNIFQRNNFNWRMHIPARNSHQTGCAAGPDYLYGTRVRS